MHNKFDDQHLKDARKAAHEAKAKRDILAFKEDSSLGMTRRERRARRKARADGIITKFNEHEAELDLLDWQERPNYKVKLPPFNPQVFNA